MRQAHLGSEKVFRGFRRRHVIDLTVGKSGRRLQLCVRRGLPKRNLNVASLIVTGVLIAPFP